MTLPVKTNFCAVEIPLFEGLSLWVDGNSKITWDNGTYAEPKPNAFSLPHIATCPGSTERCRKSCYVWGLRQHAPEVYKHYELNEMTLHAVLDSTWRRLESAKILAGWIAENARGGFRWHVSGDVFSQTYARWIANVCRLAPDVAFWIYTRSLTHVHDLIAAPNLAVNISVDKHNWEKAQHVANLGRLCYLVSEPDEVIPALPEGSVIFPDYPLRGRSLPIATEAPWWKTLGIETKRMVCVADFFGQSEEYRCGPCKKCLHPAGKEVTT